MDRLSFEGSSTAPASGLPMATATRPTNAASYHHFNPRRPSLEMVLDSRGEEPVMRAPQHVRSPFCYGSHPRPAADTAPQQGLNRSIDESADITLHQHLRSKRPGEVSQQGQPAKRPPKRSTAANPACDRCRKKKEKCDRPAPGATCRRCSKAGASCEVKDVLLKRGPASDAEKDILARAGVPYKRFRERIAERRQKMVFNLYAPSEPDVSGSHADADPPSTGAAQIDAAELTDTVISTPSLGGGLGAGSSEAGASITGFVDKVDSKKGSVGLCLGPNGEWTATPLTTISDQPTPAATPIDATPTPSSTMSPASQFEPYTPTAHLAAFLVTDVDVEDAFFTPALDRFPVQLQIGQSLFQPPSPAEEPVIFLDETGVVQTLTKEAFDEIHGGAFGSEWVTSGPRGVSISLPWETFKTFEYRSQTNLWPENLGPFDERAYDGLISIAYQLVRNPVAKQLIKRFFLEQNHFQPRGNSDQILSDYELLMVQGLDRTGWTPLQKRQKLAIFLGLCSAVCSCAPDVADVAIGGRKYPLGVSPYGFSCFRLNYALLTPKDGFWSEEECTMDLMTGFMLTSLNLMSCPSSFKAWSISNKAGHEIHRKLLPKLTEPSDLEQIARSMMSAHCTQTELRLWLDKNISDLPKPVLSVSVIPGEYYEDGMRGATSRECFRLYRAWLELMFITADVLDSSLGQPLPDQEPFAAALIERRERDAQQHYQRLTMWAGKLASGEYPTNGSSAFRRAEQKTTKHFTCRIRNSFVTVLDMIATALHEVDTHQITRQEKRDSISEMEQRHRLDSHHMLKDLHGAKVDADDKVAQWFENTAYDKASQYFQSRQPPNLLSQSQSLPQPPLANKDDS